MDHDQDTKPSKSGAISWASAMTIGAAVLVPLITAWVGYQSGAATVNKDYTALAIEIVKDKNSPPETRKWAITVLNKLSPVPFTDKVKAEISAGGLVSPFVFAPLKLSKTPMAIKCAPIPPFTDGTQKGVESYLIKMFALYTECAARKQSLVDLLAKFEEDELAKMKELGLPDTFSTETKPPEP